MKSQRSLFMLVALVAATAFSASAQPRNPLLENPKYGPDAKTREECLKHTSYYTGFYRNNNFKDAEQSWGIVYTICPRSSENVFIRGIRMLKLVIAEEKNLHQKKILVDSLMRIYDKKSQYYGKEGQNLALKGIDLFTVAPEREEEIADILGKSLELEGDNTDPQAMLVYMQVTKNLYASSKRTADDVVNLYARLSGIFAKQIAALPSADQISAMSPQKQEEAKEEAQKLNQMSESLDILFTTAGVANCDNLITIYQAKFEKEPNNLELARSIHSQLSALRCTDADLYLSVSKLLFQAQPTSAIGVDIARILQAKNNNAGAADYFRRAVAAETDSLRKANILLEFAQFVGTRQGELPKARTLAYEALSLNPNLGYAYLLIGSLYAQTKACGASKMDNVSVYWAAVDKFSRAMAVQPDISSECQKQINYYSQFFPTTEEIFFQDLEVGKPYTVPCWINEKTTIRAKK